MDKYDRAKIKQMFSFGNLQPLTVHILVDFPSFLWALPSNNAFITVKIWLGGAPHVMVGSLKVSLDRHFY